MSATNSIQIFDASLSLIAYIDSYQSATFERKWYEAGDFSFTMNHNTLYASECLVDRIVMFGDDVYKCGIIEEVVKKEGADGKGDMQVTVKGRECKTMFEQRYVQPPTGYSDYTATTNAESVLKIMVALQIGSTASANRRVPNFTIANNLSRGATYTLSTRWKVLSEVTKDVTTATGLGQFIYLDLANKTFVYDVGAGVDRRSTQSINGRAIFSSDFDTIESAEFTKSNVKKKNLIYSAGQGVGDARLIRTVYDTTEPAGLARKEFFYDYRTLATNAALDSAGAAKLVELSTDTYIDGSALTYSQLVLGTDYNLGDLVTVETYGETIHPRIVGIQESWAPSSYKIHLTYDRNYPEFSKQVASNVGDQTRLNNSTEGTVVESSSNANGRYRKFSDGTMDQWGIVAPTSGSFALTNGVYVQIRDITYPYAFYDTAYVFVGHVETQTNGCFWVGERFITSKTLTGNSVYINSMISGTFTVGVAWHAIGRWRA